MIKKLLHSPRALWFMAAGYMGLIWLVSSFELPHMPIHRVPFSDKGVHFIEYAVLGCLLTLACFASWAKKGPKGTFIIVRLLVLGVWLSILWGVLDELHQAHVPGRSADLLDIFADALGAVIGAVLALMLRSLAKPRRRAAAQ